MPKTTRYVAFLRGINVGAARRVAMADLRELCAELGFEEVRSQGQSGNLVLDSPAAAAKVERTLAGGIRRSLELDVSVVVRTVAELAAVVERNPFARYVEEPRYSTVSFLAEEPAAGVLDALDPADYLPERFELHGRELYILYAHGQIRSGLHKVLSDRALGTAATNRNWNTLEKVLALAAK